MFKPTKYMKAAAFTAAFMLAATTFAGVGPWFDAGISSLSSWPGSGWSSSAQATAPVADMAVISNSALDIDTSDAELQYAVDPYGLGNAPLVVTSSQKFTPAASLSELPDPAAAKGGLAVVKQDTDPVSYAYFGIVKIDAANAWVELAGATPSDPANTEVTTTITVTDVNGLAKISYKVGSTDLNFAGQTANEIANIAIDVPVTKVAYAGCGTVSALSGTKNVPDYTVTVPAVAGATAKLYVNDVEQVGVDGVYTLPNGTAYSIVFTATDGNYEVSGSPINGTVSGDNVSVDVTGVEVVAKKYDLTYDANTGVGDDVIVKYDVETVGMLAKGVGTESGQIDFTKAGYTFNSWNTESDGSGDTYEAGDMVPMTSGGYTLYAQWDVAEYTITVTEGSASASTYTVAGAVITLTPPQSAPTGKEFGGWIASPSAGVSFVGSTMTIAAGTTGDITVTPNFTLIAYVLRTDNCTINPEYYYYDTENPSVITVTPPVLGRGYEVKGYTCTAGSVVDGVWTIPANTTGGQTITCTTGLATYTIVIDVNGGTASGTADPTYQISASQQQFTLTKPTAPANKEFDAWVLSEKEGVSIDGDTVTIQPGIIGNVAVQATWKDAAGPTLPTYMQGQSQAMIGKYNTWAETYGADTASAYEEAFLLNCAPAQVAVQKALFVIPSISIDGEGNVTVCEPTGDYNGVIVIRGAATVDGPYTLDEDAETARFFKAFLEMPAPVNN